MGNFARLETHGGLQVLSRIEEITDETGEIGPAVITRCDPSFTVETKEGIWPDDESGWDAAEAFMAGKDLAEFASAAKKFCEKMKG